MEFPETNVQPAVSNTPPPVPPAINPPPVKKKGGWFFDLFVNAVLVAALVQLTLYTLDYHFIELTLHAGPLLSAAISAIQFPFIILGSVVAFIANFFGGQEAARGLGFLLGFGAGLFAPLFGSVFYLFVFVFVSRMIRSFSVNKLYIWGLQTIFVFALALLIVPVVFTSSEIQREQTHIQEVRSSKSPEQLLIEDLKQCMTHSAGTETSDRCVNGVLSANTMDYSTLTARQVLNGCFTLPDTVPMAKEGQNNQISSADLISQREYCVYSLAYRLHVPRPPATSTNPLYEDGRTIGDPGFLNIWGYYTESKTLMAFLQKDLCTIVASSTTRQDEYNRCLRYTRPEATITNLKSPLDPNRTLPKGTPAATELTIPVQPGADLLLFDLGFTGEEGSVGEVKVFIDNKLVAIIDEAKVPPRVNNYAVPFGPVTDAREIKLKFVLTPLVPAYRSEIKLGQILPLR